MFACAHATRRSSGAPVCVSRKASGVLRKTISDGPTPWSRLATSIRVSTPDEASEHEADRVADIVTRRDTPASVGGAAGARAGTGPSPGAAIVNRESASDDRARRPMGGAGYLDRLHGRGQPLPLGIRGELEPRFGHDFSDVRVHTDGEAARSALDFNALAYTYDRHVVFGAGQFDSTSAGGRRLIAHELAHVVQQSGPGARPAVQRKGPFDLQPDLCITAPVVGTVCGSGAAKVCGKMPSLPGCGAVCKVMDCPKSKDPTTICPNGWQATTAKGFEGQCCRGDIASAQACCPPSRIATQESLVGRCCGAEEVVVDQKCVKSKDLPSLPLPQQLCFPPGKPTLFGKCCYPPLVPKGMDCGLPDAPPKPALPVFPPIFFGG